MVLLSPSKVWLLVQRNGGMWRFLTWTRSHLSLHRHPEMSREGVEETLLILQESQYYSLLEWVDAVSRWMFSGLDLLHRFWFVHLRLEKIKFSLFGKYHLFRIESFSSRFQMRPSFPTPQSLQPVRHPSNFTPRTMRIRGTIQVRLFFQIDGFLTDPSQLIGWYSTNEPKVIIGPLNGCPKRLSYGVFPIRQKILNVSQIATAFHVESAHQLSSRPDCNNTAEVPSFTLRTALSAIPLVSDLCGVDVQWFQERSSQNFSEFQGIVSVNDYWLPLGLQELLQAALGFLWSFVFARIRLDPLSS